VSPQSWPHRRLRCLTLAATLILGLAQPLLATGQTGAASSAPAPILIGATRSESGRQSDASRLMHRGMDLWLADLRERGGLLNRPIKLVVADDASSPEAAAAAYRRMLAEGVSLFVSPYSSDLTLAVQEALAGEDYAMVSVASDPQIWQGGEPRIFGLYTPADQNMVPALAIAQQSGYRRVGIAHLDARFPAAVALGAKREAERLGLTALPPIVYQENGDYDAVARQLLASRPDVVLVGSYLEDAVQLSAAARRVGLAPSMLIFSGGPALRDYGQALGQRNVTGVLSTAQWMRSVRFPGAFDFGFRYREQHRVYPSYDAAGGYAALQVLDSAVRLAGSADASAIRSQLAQMKFRSILGHYRVDSSGRQIAKDTYVVQWQDGHISLVWPPQLARWELALPFKGFAGD
jgi:branched-chain amino acid transport system substrate-binding protein